jgi:hypothetical protein
MPANVTNPWTELAKKYRSDRPTWKEPDPAFIGKTPLKLTGLVKWYDENTLHLFKDLDGLLVWAGQHGTSNSPIPPVGDDWSKLTNPQDSAVIYGSYLIRGINAFRSSDPVAKEEVWLCPDPRNYLKARDLKWPLRHPILAQYVQTRPAKWERYAYDEKPDPIWRVNSIEARHVWVTPCDYTYSALELTALPEPDEIPMPAGSRSAFGLIMNENRAYVSNSRLKAMQDWILPHFPDVEMYGAWCAESLKTLGRDIQAVPLEQMYVKMAQWKSTFTTPASGSGWSTAKPWEAFALGTVCFFHPGYDIQGHIVPTLAQVKKHPEAYSEEMRGLAGWLRVSSPEQLAKRVAAIDSDDATYGWLRDAQRRLFEARFAEQRIETMIHERLGL